MSTQRSSRLGASPLSALMGEAPVSPPMPEVAGQGGSAETPILKEVALSKVPPVEELAPTLKAHDGAEERLLVVAELPRPARPSGPKVAATPVRSEKRRKLTTRLDTKLYDEIQDATYWVPGLSVQKLIEDAVRTELKKIRKRDNGGAEFESRPKR